MRILGKDCGCDARRDIIFDAGKIGAPEAAILVLALLAVGFAVSYNKIEIGGTT
jgi:hypothetical protein